MSSLIFPSYVQKGDRIIILSPSSKIDKSFLKGAKKRLKSWGLEVVMAKHAGSSHGTYGGSIKQRVEDLQNALDDEKAKVILCSRGGYGAVHLLGKLDFTRFREHPKWLIGFSDITALHNVLQKEGFASLHALMARHLTVESEDDFCTLALKDILFGHFNPETADAVERMIYNLKLGGILEKLSGLIIGQFTEYEENKSLGKELYGAIADLVKEYDYPVCFNFPVGHVSMNLPMINGAEVTLETGRKEVKLSFNLDKE